MDDRTTEQLTGALQAIEILEQRPCLMALRGPEKGASFVLREGDSVLGRAQDQSEIVLMGRGISRAHARINVGSNSIVIVDLGSTNGIFVNGTRVDRANLVAGDTVGLGPEVLLRLDVSDGHFQEVLQDLYEGANLDGLTGVLNRRSFLNRVREEYAAGKRHQLSSCLALLDIDHFKTVNDTYGHPAGDAILVQIAQIFGAALRTEDVLGRYGGEEFIILLRHSDLTGACTVLERIRENVARQAFLVPTPGGDQTISVTVSGGLAELTPGGAGVDVVIQAADQALYEAKRGGRNQVRQGQ